MKVKIVKFNNGKYAVRKGWLVKNYADINDMRRKRSIFWWSSMEYAERFLIDNLEDLKEIVSEYKGSNLKEVEVIETVNLNID